MKLGWLDPNEIVQVSSAGAIQILHALSLPRPSPPGRITALSFPTGNSLHYFLIEARLKTDPYEAGMPNLSAGIPNEGVVVYEIDESVPPSPVHLRTTPRALGVGEQYTNSGFQFQVQVLAAVPGGFQVQVQVVENPQCASLRTEIAALKAEITSLQSDLANAAGSQKAAIAAEIKQKQGELHQKELEYAGLGCKS
jgi:hypothetical protein